VSHGERRLVYCMFTLTGTGQREGGALESMVLEQLVSP
jgi:hypothetical protein